MKTSVRFGLGIGLVVILLLVIAAVSVSRLSRQNERLEFMVSERYSKMAMVMEIENEINVIAISLRNMMLTDSHEDMLKQEGRILEARKKIEENIEKIQRKTIILPKGKELLQHVLDNRKRYIEGSKHLVTLIEEGKKDESRAYLTHVLRPILADYQASLDAFGKFNVELMHVTVQEAAENYNSARNMAMELALIAVVLVLAASVVFWLTRGSTKPFNPATSIPTSRLGVSDVTARIDVTPKDETGQLLVAMQNMVAKLSQVVVEIRRASDNLSSASKGVSAFPQSISHAASGQGVKEYTEGGESVRQTVFAMKQIAKKIGDVNDIAHQTNLLALNAAIKAARVDSNQDKDMVAAEEACKLAERSQVVAQEISELVSSSVQMAEEADKLLDEMAPSINKSSDLT